VSKFNSDYPCTNNQLSHQYLSGSENLGANHVCTSQHMDTLDLKEIFTTKVMDTSENWGRIPGP
jgi:hypothetical protein